MEIFNEFTLQWEEAKTNLPEWLLKIQRAILLFHGEKQ